VAEPPKINPKHPFFPYPELTLFRIQMYFWHNHTTAARVDFQAAVFLIQLGEYYIPAINARPTVPGPA